MPPQSELVQLLKERGLKLTPQRHLVCSLLTQLSGHPTAEEIHAHATRMMPTLSLKTVYSTLYELVEMGAVRLINPGPGGFRVESNLEPHSHLVCRRCGHILDAPADPLGDRSWSDLPVPDFRIEAREVIFRGLCKECADSPASRPNPRSHSREGAEHR